MTCFASNCTSICFSIPDFFYTGSVLWIFLWADCNVLLLPSSINELSKIFPGGSDGKESTCNAGQPSSIPGLGRSPGGGHGNPLQYPCLENPHGQRRLVGYSPWGCRKLAITEWQSTAKSLTWIWANSGRWWGTGRPSVLQSMRSQRVAHEWETEQQQWNLWQFPWWLSSKESALQCRRCGFNPWVGKILWRRKWQPTPVSQGLRSLVGYSPWGHKS